MRESERKCSPTKLNTNTEKDQEMVTLVKRHYLCVTQASDAWPAVNFIWEDSLILHWWSEMTTCNNFFLNCTHKHLRLPLTSMIKHRHTTTQLIKTQVDTLKSSASKGSLCFYTSKICTLERDRRDKNRVKDDKWEHSEDRDHNAKFLSFLSLTHQTQKCLESPKVLTSLADWGY